MSKLIQQEVYIKDTTISFITKFAAFKKYFIHSYTLLKESNSLSDKDILNGNSLKNSIKLIDEFFFVYFLSTKDGLFKAETF